MNIYTSPLMSVSNLFELIADAKAEIQYHFDNGLHEGNSTVEYLESVTKQSYEK